MEPLLPELERWHDRGRTVSVFGLPVFCLEQGSRAAEPLLVLHGFPTSCFDFHRTVETLASRFRVVMHDHLGFGFSAKPAGYSYSLFEQAEVALGVWRAAGITRGHLLAHDYGTSVATELLARRERGLLPCELLSVTLSNGSLYLELARLRLAQRLARSPHLGPLFGRLVPGSYFKRVMRGLWGNPARADEEDLEAMWQGIRHREGHRRSHQVSSYLDERHRFRHRWLGALQRLDLPVHILWGRRDPVAVAAIAERLAAEVPNAALTWLDALGHYPMLEDPSAWAEAVVSFLTSEGAEARP